VDKKAVRTTFRRFSFHVEESTLPLMATNRKPPWMRYYPRHFGSAYHRPEKCKAAHIEPIVMLMGRYAYVC
jgi:hypothetical protein